MNSFVSNADLSNIDEKNIQVGIHKTKDEQKQTTKRKMNATI